MVRTPRSHCRVPGFRVSIPGLKAKIPQTTQCGQKKEQEIVYINLGQHLIASKEDKLH